MQCPQLPVDPEQIVLQPSTTQPPLQLHALIVPSVTTEPTPIHVLNVHPLK